jgi:TolB-like protein/Flp pilus assembly protein TadD
MAAKLRASWKEDQCPACPLEMNLSSPRKDYLDQQVAGVIPEEKAPDCGWTGAMISSPHANQGIDRTPMQNSSSQRQSIHFGSFVLDLHAGELHKQGVKIKLQEQPFQILAMLLEHPGEVVTREQLRARLWPSDTFVDFDHSLNKAINKLREALGDSAENPHFIETLAKRGYRFMRDLQGNPGQIRSLLVLPLENLSRDPEQEYFADGLTEELITKLARISALRVLSRTTAMHYKGVRKPLPEIARELQVEGVVEGTVLRSGEQVRISAQLIHAPSDTHLWANSYERDLRNVLTLQSEVAQAIAREVQVKLTPQEQAQFAQVHPVDPEAYEAYLKGRYHWNKRSREGHGKAIQYFQQAITKDPGYAAAYSGLADARSIMGLWGLVPPEEGCGRAKGLALRALEMNGSLAEAHTSLAWATMHYDYEFLAAEREFERSLELNPRYAMAHHMFGFCLAMMGRYEEGYTELQRALRLEPHWSNIHFGSAFVYWSGRRYDQAIDRCQKALELDPSSVQALGWLGLSYAGNLMFEPAIAALRKAVDLSQGAPVPVAFLGESYAAARRCAEARNILQELSKQRHVPAYSVSRIYAALGERDEALRWLETAYRERGEWLVLLKVDPRFDALRSDPQFQDLMMRMNFPVE